ncbi:MAG: hypothetical protein ACR2PI_21540 [Hyphomicrobiaceae bacterium]
MDLVPLANTLGGVASNSNTLLTGAGILLIVLFLLFSQFGKRLGKMLHDVMFTNWRLGLLGLTGVVLSIASGWTTWDGMSNFTKEPLLSALVTFGIQGVMLIVAWLIGESFATGMNHRPTRAAAHASPTLSVLQPVASSIAGILLFTAIGILIYSAFGSPDAVESARVAGAPWWNNWWDKLAIAAPVVVLVTLLIVNAGSDVLADYTQSLRVMIRSAVLWVMFLACMATSVFFSFDSLFSTIFPASERQRAADLRAQNQVAGIVNDVGSLAATRRLSEQEAFFANEAWTRYSANLDELTTVTVGAEDKLQAFMEQKLRERQSQLNRFQEDKSSAEAQKVSLTQRKGQLNSEIGRLKEQVSGIAPEVARLKGLVFDKDRELIAKQAEAEAEAGGIGVTSKVGRGPKYREIKKQLDRLVEEKKNLELQLREFQKRLDAARKKLTQSETELTQTDGEIAKLRSRSETATRMIDARAKRDDGAPSFNATDGQQQLASAREAFRREPTAAGLTRIQSLCGTIVGAMREQPVLQAQTSRINCDPGAASEAASRLFALNAGVIALQQRCIGGDKLPSGGADVLFAFARRCVQDAGLPSSDTANLRQQINIIELNRDDKAHRFVVTTNAFQDGNKLAYLALSIAIAIDALVFMSGLFGANAVRSPLSDVPSHKGRSARQLESVVENALLPDKFENAMHALEEIQPVSGMAPTSLGPGWTHETVVRDGEFGTKSRMLKVLNAGATIGAVRRDETYPARYFIRGELVEFLNQVSKSAFESDKDKVKLAELRKILTVALQPRVSDNADIVLGHMHPITETNECTSEIFMHEVEADQVPIVKRALNAGSTLSYVQRDERKEEYGRFYIHKNFYRTLALISAEHSAHGRLGYQQLPAPDQAAVDGGQLDAADAMIAGPNARVAQQQITDETARYQTPVAEAAVEISAAPEAGPPKGEEAEMRQAFVEKFLRILHIEPTLYLELQGQSWDAAVDASEAFKAQRRANQLLESNLNVRDRQAHQSVVEAYDQMATEIVGEDANFQHQMLVDARNEIEQNWAIIMMLPGGPYEVLFTQMIEEYQEDENEGALDEANEVMLHKARALRVAVNANPRSSPEDWEKLERDISGAGDNSNAEVVPINSRRA